MPRCYVNGSLLSTDKSAIIWGRFASPTPHIWPPLAPDNVVVSDSFDNGILGTNPNTGSGWSDTSQSGCSASESGGTARLTTDGASGIASMVSNDEFQWFDDAGVTISWRWKSEETNVNHQKVDFAVYKNTITFGGDNQPLFDHEAAGLNTPEGTPSIILSFTHENNNSEAKLWVNSPDGADEPYNDVHSNLWGVPFPTWGWGADDNTWLDVTMKLNNDGYMLTFSESLRSEYFGTSNAYISEDGKSIWGTWCKNEDGQVPFWNDFGDIDWAGGSEAIFAVATAWSGTDPGQQSLGTILVDSLTITDSASLTLGTISGDTDWDADSDNVDFGALYGNFTGPEGADKTWEHGDFDGDGDVDNVDFGTLYGNYTGPLAGGMDLQVTPEPGMLALLGLGGAAMLRRRRR